MKRFFRESLSPTMAVAILALVVATAGSGYAAARIGHESAPAAQSAAAAPAQPVLKSGQKMIGYYVAAGTDGTTGYIGDAISFPAKLPANFNNNHVQYVEAGDPFTTECPGPGTARKNWMCFYEGQSNGGATICCIYKQNYSTGTSDYGVRLYWTVTGSSNYADGQWVVRAP